jgi:YesN/AraC family two-component response regulator
MRKPRVIILDDEDLVLHGLKRWMSRKGFEVLIFKEPDICLIQRNSIECCTKEEQCSDIFITDFKMPQMSGIDLLQYQKQRGCMLETRNKAIISGFTDDFILRATDKLNCSFFRKPFQLSEISEWLSECEKRIDLSLPLRSLKGFQGVLSAQEQYKSQKISLQK